MDRSLAAEVRAVEEGHRAFLLDGENAVRVVSDVELDVAYRVEATAYETGPILFVCQPIDRRTGVYVEATHRRRTEAPGRLPCKHAAVAVHRLEREGLAERIEGEWRATDLAAEIDRSRRPNPPADPFAGLT